MCLCLHFINESLHPVFHCRELINKKKARECEEEERRKEILAERKARIQDVTYRYQRGSAPKSPTSHHTNHHHHHRTRPKSPRTSECPKWKDNVLLSLVRALLRFFAWTGEVCIWIVVNATRCLILITYWNWIGNIVRCQHGKYQMPLLHVTLPALAAGTCWA